MFHITRDHKAGEEVPACYEVLQIEHSSAKNIFTVTPYGTKTLPIKWTIDLQK